MALNVVTDVQLLQLFMPSTPGGPQLGSPPRYPHHSFLEEPFGGIVTIWFQKRAHTHNNCHGAVEKSEDDNLQIAGSGQRVAELRVNYMLQSPEVVNFYSNISFSKLNN